MAAAGGSPCRRVPVGTRPPDPHAPICATISVRPGAWRPTVSAGAWRAAPRSLLIITAASVSGAPTPECSPSTLYACIGIMAQGHATSLCAEAAAPPSSSCRGGRAHATRYDLSVPRVATSSVDHVGDGVYIAPCITAALICCMHSCSSLNDAAHPWMPLRANDIRGPCPGLNTLASHGVCHIARVICCPV